MTVGTIALASLSGCSLAFVEGPPSNHASRRFFDCSSSMLAPGLDAAFAATMGLGTLGATSDGSHDASSIAFSSALLVGSLASATYGYIQVSHCRQAKEALAARLIDAPYLGVLPPAPAQSAPGPGSSDRTHAPAAPDPWLSEGPPPQPYLRPAPPTTVVPPPETAAPAPPDVAPPPPPTAAPAPAEDGPPQ